MGGVERFRLSIALPLGQEISAHFLKSYWNHTVGTG